METYIRIVGNGYNEELDYSESLGGVEVSHRDAFFSQRTSISSVTYSDMFRIRCQVVPVNKTTCSELVILKPNFCTNFHYTSVFVYDIMTTHMMPLILVDIRSEDSNL